MVSCIRFLETMRKFVVSWSRRTLDWRLWRMEARRKVGVNLGKEEGGDGQDLGMRLSWLGCLSLHQKAGQIKGQSKEVF